MDGESIRLTESTYAILLAARTPIHGYGIMQRAKAMSNGRIVIGPGTMYGALKKLIADRWIAVQTVDGQKIYTTTTLGREVVRQEYERLTLLIEMYGGDVGDQG